MPPDLREGLYLEDSGVLLPWGCLPRDLASRGHPEVGGGRLCWRDRRVFGGLPATVCVELVQNTLFRRAELQFAIDHGRTFEAGLACFTEVVHLLGTRFGDPHAKRLPSSSGDSVTGGFARWLRGRVQIEHAFSFATGQRSNERPSNLTTVELVSINWRERVREFTERWLGGTTDPYADLVGEGGKRALRNARSDYPWERPAWG